MPQDWRMGISYLFRMESTSPRTLCSGIVTPFTDFVDAVADAPLRASGLDPVRFRFVSEGVGDGEGEVGAGGSDGGVRVPLAATVVMLMVMMGDVRDVGVMPWRGATRSGRPGGQLTAYISVPTPRARRGKMLSLD